MDNQLLMFSTSKKAEIKNESLVGGHYSKVKRTTSYRSQPYDRSSPSTSRSSTGTPPSSPDQNCGEIDGSSKNNQQPSNPVVRKEQKKRREEANKRERTRMHTVNSAFDHLRQLVPTYPSNRKLSKIETLRLACSYIQDLTKLVNDHNIQAMHGEDVNLMYRSELDGGSAYGSNGGPPHYSTSTNVSQQQNTAAGGGAAAYMNPMTAPAASISTASSKADFSSPAGPGEFTTTSQQPHSAVGSYYHPAPTMTPAGTTMGYVNSDPESQSESDIPSPNTCHYSNMFMTPTPPVPTGIAVRPPPAMSRVGSDTIIAMQMANASISSSSPTYCGSPSAGAPCSPLTRAQHSSPSITHSQITSTLQCNPSPLSSIQPSFTSIHAPIFPQCYSQ